MAETLARAQVFCVWLTPNQDLAYVLATGYVASSILLSGFYLRVTDMALGLMRSLSYLSYTKCAPRAPDLRSHVSAVLVHVPQTWVTPPTRYAQHMQLVQRGHLAC